MNPRLVEGFGSVEGLSAGDNKYCAVTDAGRVRCLEWGISETVEEVSGLSDVVDVASTSQFSCALTGDAGMKCWGQFDGASTSSSTPEPLEGTPDDLVEVDAYSSFMCGRTGGGDVHCWGRNNAGQLGDFDGDYSAKPIQIDVSRAKALAVGARHACIISEGDELECWGSLVYP